MITNRGEERSNLAVQHVREPVRRVVLHVRQRVRVHVQRHRHVGVPSLAATTCTGTPAANSNVAQVWRRPWHLIRFTPEMGYS